MIADILTVMWKEWKSLFRTRGSVGRILVIMLSWSYFSIYSPLSEGSQWLNDLVLSMITAFFLPTVMVSMTIIDSFAGERERHTLETLLASRLPDRAILFGKMGFSVTLAWATTLTMLLVGLILVNVAHWQGQLMFFGPYVALTGIVGSLLVATLAASVGVIISMRSATTQEAAQLMTAVLLAPPMVVGVLLTLVISQVGDFFENVRVDLIVAGILAILVVLTAGLLYAAMARFQRSRLSSTGTG